MKTSLPVYRDTDGVMFAATERVHAELDAYPAGMHSDEQVRAFVSTMWDRHLEAMLPEHDRMLRCEDYYNGFHYASPSDNHENEITNYPFSIVESVWPEMIEQDRKSVV